MDEKLTSESLDAIHELRHSPGWHLLIGRIIPERDRKCQELERAGTTERTSDFNRGFVAALRMVLRLPELIEDDAKAEVTKNGA